MEFWPNAGLWRGNGAKERSGWYVALDVRAVWNRSEIMVTPLGAVQCGVASSNAS